MGQGRSSTSIKYELVPVDDYEGNEIEIDIDIDLNENEVEDYETDRIYFNMSAEDLDDFLKNALAWVYVEFDESFYTGDSPIGEIVSYEHGFPRVFIHDEDMRYAVYKAVVDVLKVQDAFNKCMGTDEYDLVGTLTFKNHIKDEEKGVRGTSEDHYNYATSTLQANIEIESSRNRVLRKADLESLINGWTLDTSRGSGRNFLIERNSYQDGWFSVTGTYQKSTIDHELGHAVFTALANFSSFDSKKFLVEDWFYRTRGNPVSGYSQKNYDEAFAECFNLFIHGGKSNSKMYKEFLTEVAPDLGISNMYGTLK